MMDRTPPNTLSTQKSGSEPDIVSKTQENALTQAGSNSSLFNVVRLKRSRDDANVEFNELKDEFNLMFTAWKRDQDSKFNAILSAMTEIKEQNADIRNSMEFMSQKYDELLMKVNTMDDEQKNYLKYINTLENKIETMERNLKSSHLELRNIPKKQNESKEDLIYLLKNTGKALNTPIQDSDIKDIYRINNKSEGNRPVVAELTSTILKENIIRKAKNYNKENKTAKLNSNNLQLDGPPIPIYVSDCLTPKARRLFFLAREFANTNNFSFCWTLHGKIFLRRSEGSPVIHINCEEDLKNLIKK